MDFKLLSRQILFSVKWQPEQLVRLDHVRLRMDGGVGCKCCALTTPSRARNIHAPDWQDLAAVRDHMMPRNRTAFPLSSIR